MSQDVDYCPTFRIIPTDHVNSSIIGLSLMKGMNYTYKADTRDKTMAVGDNGLGLD